MPTLEQIRNRVYSVIRDSDKAFVIPESVDDWVNEACLDVAIRLQLTKQQTTGTTSATGTIALPADFVKSLTLTALLSSSDAEQTRIEFVDDDIYDSWRLAEATPPAGAFGRIFGSNIETYPNVVSMAYTLRYLYAPATLDSNADVPDLPVEQHIRLVNYARAHAKYQEGELDEGDRYMGLYQAGLPAPPSSYSRQHPGPFSLTPAPSYWDGDPP